MRFFDKLRHRWSKLVTPVMGQIPAQDCWQSAWDYYHYYQYQNLPGLYYYPYWSTYQETYPIPRSIYPQPHHAFYWTKITMP